MVPELGVDAPFGDPGADGVEARPVEPDREVAVHAVGPHRVALDRLEQRDAGIAVAEHDWIALAVPDVGEPALHREHVLIPRDRALMSDTTSATWSSP